MCGIAGLLDPRPHAEVDRALLARMAEAIAHRGPDGQGLHVEGGIGLAHRRLAIIDLGGGAQPLYSPDRRAVIVFNGEIYNFRELRRELEARGRRFATSSDTEVILAAWEAWGAACVQRLRGMFAFALWDVAQRELLIARDRFGIKPLYWAKLPDGRIAFASELKSLLVLGSALPRRLREDALVDYVTLGYIPEPKTVLHGAHRLLPGELVRIDGRTGTMRFEKYWDIRFDARGEEDGPELRREVLERLDESVGAHLVADVPVSTFLSGGVDSSAVVASAARKAGTRLVAWSIGFDDENFNETGYATQVARVAGVDHRIHPVHLDPSRDLSAMVRCYDEPFADPSAIPTWELCRIAASSCKVALSGDGGDEVFAGYPWYSSHRKRVAYLRAPPPVRRALGSAAQVAAGTAWPFSWRLPGTGFLLAGAHDAARAYVTGQSPNAWIATDPVLHHDINRRMEGYETAEIVRRLFADAPTDDVVQQAQYADFKLYLTGDILTKVDRASMAASLEVRVPFLDHRLVEWALSLGTDILMRGGAKGLLKRSLESTLPRGVLYRRKQGFSVPLDEWFRRDLAASIDRLLERPTHPDLWRILDARQVRRIVEAHRGGRLFAGNFLWATYALATSLPALDGTL